MVTRKKAFSIHLLISAVIAICISVPLLLLWYTPSLFLAADAQKLLLLLLGVDVTLGPLITLVIFNSKKSRKELTIDLSIIATLQLAALIYGMSITFQARPVFIAFTQDSFTVANAYQLYDINLADSTYPEFKSLPLTGPVYVYAEMPSDEKEKNDIETSKIFGLGLACFPKYYKPYTEHMITAGKAARPIAELKSLKQDHIAEINKAIEHSGKTESEIGYLPLKGMKKDLTILLGKNDGKIIEILPISTE